MATAAHAQRLDGKAAAKRLREQVAQDVDTLKARGVTPGLRVIQVGAVAASSVYVKKKAEMAAKLGIDSAIIKLSETVTESELLTHIQTLNTDASVHAILLQLPLPQHLDPLVFQLATEPGERCGWLSPPKPWPTVSRDDPIGPTVYSGWCDVDAR